MPSQLPEEAIMTPDEGIKHSGLEICERVENADRRSFLRQTSLATLSAIVGTSIPFYRNLPDDFIPAAVAQENVLMGKDGLTLLANQPLNAETPPELLDDAITPTSRHFIRNNGIPPLEIDPGNWMLTIDGFVDNPLVLSIKDMHEQFEVVTMALILECCGNGRAFFDPPVKGNQWTYGAVACSEWTGVRLKDVLEKAGVQSSVVYTAHYGADTHPSGNTDILPISRGLPISKAMTDNILIAFEMNGTSLHPMNGAPLRLVVPGWPASTSQKWLTRIELRDQVHDGALMTGMSYRVPAYPISPGQEVPIEDFVIIERMPIKSLVTFPANGAETGMETQVRGHAWSGDRTVKRVDISIDFGSTWIETELDAPINSGAWQNWQTNVKFPLAGYYEVWARALDSEGVMQPFAINWNPKGYINNTMHRVGISAS